MKILYAFPSASRHDRHDYHREIAVIDAAMTSGRGCPRTELTTVEFRSRTDLRRALLTRAPQLVVLAGHGPNFGLFEAATPERREHCAAVLAEELAMCCAPNACVLLMGCSSSWLTPALAQRGLRGASFDLPLPAPAVLAFIEAFFDGVCAGHSVETAYEFGCMAMAYDYPEASRQARWFGPEFDWLRGRYHQWLVEPARYDDAC